MSNPTIAQRLAAVHERIAAAAIAARRKPASVRLVAVSKTVDAAAVGEALAAGQLAFAENRVQELTAKAALLPAECEWHLIGHLQHNKARAAVRTATWIHSVDSIELLERLDRIAAEEERRPKVLLQVNLTGEKSKSGFTPMEVLAATAVVRACTHLDCQGFMTMAGLDADEAALRACFSGLRKLRDGVAPRYGLPLRELSMGMSGDYEVAIAEGATMVRIGTAVFGPRQAL